MVYKKINSLRKIIIILLITLLVFIEIYNYCQDERVFPAKLTMPDISGNWVYHQGKTLHIKYIEYFSGGNRLLNFRIADALPNRYLEAYRFTISPNNMLNMYNFYLFEHSLFSEYFDFSDKFLLAKGDLSHIDYSKLHHSRNAKYSADEIYTTLCLRDPFLSKNYNSRDYAYQSMQFFLSEKSEDIIAAVLWEKDAEKFLSLNKTSLNNISLKDNLVLYEELDSVKAQDVTVLSLAGLDFENIPQKLKNFPQIKKLFMPFNKVKFTDADFEVLESLPNLEVLDIRGNDIANSPDPNLSRLKNLKSLKKLYMAGSKVLQEGELPNGIYEAQGLETLSVGQFGDAKLEISEDLLKLKNLKALRFYYARLKNLPPQTLRKYTWYYNCDFDSTIPRADLPQFKNKEFPEILTHAE